jgi:predicted transcriptional regulator
MFAVGYLCGYNMGRKRTYTPHLLTFKEKKEKAQNHEYTKYIKKNPNLNCQAIANYFGVEVPKANGILTALRFMGVIARNEEGKYSYIEGGL